jgi:undecaprenyl-diphosphatase
MVGIVGSSRRMTPMPRASIGLVAFALLLAGCLLAIVAGPTDERIASLVALTDAPGWLVSATRDVTALGSHLVVGVITLATAAVLLRRGDPRPALAACAQGFGAMAVAAALKALIGRPRVALDHLVFVGSSGFPSGHTVLAASLWPWLGLLLGGSHPRARRIGCALGVAIAVAIGASRLLLAVHRPSEVLGGLGIGFAWCWLWTRWAFPPVAARGL